MNWPRQIKSFNGTQKGVYHFFLNCLNSFRPALAKENHYDDYSNNGHFMVKMFPEKEKGLKFYNRQLHFEVPIKSLAHNLEAP